MRELKFRAWLNERGMSKPFGFLEIEGGFVAPENNWNESFDLEKPYLIMQYTGLKDMNDVEIYEGDLLGSRRYTGTMEVAWSEAGFATKSKVTSIFKTHTNHSPLTGKDIFEYELVVVGNIHETAELLQEVQ